MQDIALCSSLMQFQTFSAAGAANVASTIDSIDQLTGNNFQAWKEKIEKVLGVYDLDLALRKDAPVAPTAGVAGFAELKKAYDEKAEKWERSNRLSLMMIIDDS